MTIDFEDAAAAAALLLRAAEMDGDRTPDVRLLCRRLPVRLELVAPHVLRGGHAARYCMVGDRIVRRRGLPPWEDRWCIAHELGHRSLLLTHRVTEDDEAYAHAFAGALLVPAEPLFDAWRKGHDFADVMSAYPEVAPTCLALRVGEARLAETLVVQGRSLRYARAQHAPVGELVPLGIEAARQGFAAQGLAKAWRMSDAPRRAAVVYSSWLAA